MSTLRSVLSDRADRFARLVRTPSRVAATGAGTDGRPRLAARPRRPRVALVALVGAVALVAAACGGSENVVADGALKKDKGVPTLPTPTTLPDAAGKPCKAATGVPKATGKPAVEMPTGKPPTTLVKNDIKAGTGTALKKGDNFQFNYVGIACSTGKQFDSSWDAGRDPATSVLQASTAQGAGLIAGFVDGLPGMKPGGIRRLVIPPKLGYGETGQAGQSGDAGIARNETLVFVVQFIKLVPPGSTTTTAGSSTTTTAGSSTTTTAGSSTTSTTAG